MRSDGCAPSVTVVASSRLAANVEVTSFLEHPGAHLTAEGGRPRTGPERLILQQADDGLRIERRRGGVARHGTPVALRYVIA